MVAIGVLEEILGLVEEAMKLGPHFRLYVFKKLLLHHHLRATAMFVYVSDYVVGGRDQGMNRNRIALVKIETYGRFELPPSRV
jgi:hypothetical protein